MEDKKYDGLRIPINGFESANILENHSIVCEVDFESQKRGVAIRLRGGQVEPILSSTYL